MDDRSDRQSRPLGLAAFEAMSAVEGLSLDGAGRARLKQLAVTDLPPAERREAIRRVHRRK